jgi:DNA helicase-2/ATP-dependent DNA helicase PcrA
MTRPPTSPSPSSEPLFTPAGIIPTDEQRNIQTCRARHVIAMANAGAAKTTTLALRIAESVTRGVWPESIVALTFSGEAARVLKARLVEIGLDEKLARRIRCTTFEEFAQQVLGDFEGGQAPFLASHDAVAPHVRAAVRKLQLENSMRRAPRELWLPEHNDQIFEFLTLAGQLKARLVKPGVEDGESIGERAGFLDLPESVFLLYCLMEAERAGHGDAPRWRAGFDATYDLACMLTSEDCAIELPAFRIVVVDELQDMNPASYAVLEHLLARGNAFFTGAGDFDQVIHRWAGADVNFIRTRFGQGWRSVESLPLTRTYRHGPVLALVTAALKDKEVVSGRRHETRLQLETYATQRDGAGRLAACILDWTKRGGRPDACAVILRAPYQSIHIENALLEAGIGWRVEGLESYLLRSEILMLRGVIAFALEDYESIPGVEKRLQVLQALLFWQQFEWGADRRDDDALKTAAAQPELFDAFLKGKLLKPQTRADKKAAGMSGDAEITSEFHFLEKLAQLRKSGRHHEANALANIRRAESETVDESPAQRNARARLERTLAMLRAAPPDEPAHALLERAVDMLALKSVARQLFIAPSTAAMVARSIDGFIDAARRNAMSLRDFAGWLRKAEVKASRLRASATVLLCTVEAAKGQEFEAVMLPFLEDGAFPMTGCDAAEERNRFYVALTRVRDELTLFVPESAPRVSPYVAAMKIDRARARGSLQLDAQTGFQD